ncbi:cytochrome c oxidase subunit 3 [Halocola ammonii]
MNKAQATAEEKAPKKDVYEDYDPAVKVRTKKMLMYFIIFSIVMIFAAFTSAYIFNYWGQFWVHINIPTAFWVSNVIIVFSSLTIYLALRAAKRDDQKNTTIYLIATFILGVAFTISQFSGFGTLMDQGIHIAGARIEYMEGTYNESYYITYGGEKLLYDDGEYYMPSDKVLAEPITNKVNEQANTAGNYIYILTLAHVFHLLLGLIYLVVNTVRSVKGQFNSKNTISLYTNGMYWHFLGILWLYLFVFIFFIH